MKRKAVRLVPKAAAKRSGAAPARATQAPAAAERAPDFLVVGIGASAGGLDAFTRILSPIPADAQLAVVLVQHLSRSHRSLLKELLAAKTALTVVDGEDGVEIRPGFVYVIRPDTHLTVTDGHLRVSERPVDRTADAPVDRLFESLAAQYGERAIGVILSGSGHDGASGVRQIKAAGGIVLVQDLDEAESNSMPRAAVGIGDVADLVLPAEKLSAELVRLSEHPFFRRGPAEASVTAIDGAAAELVPLFQLLRRSTGVDFTHYKAPTVQRRIRRRMALHRVHELSAYVKLLQATPAEIELLHDDILIHVTGFFREPESFDVLGKSVIPELVRKHADGTPIRVWVPGCSSGEEAYSVAIVLLEALREYPQVSLQIFGTDVSHKMIARARSGIYSSSAVGALSPERQRQFFVSFEGGFRVNPSVRERCVFARQDVTRDPPFSRLDLVLCRNLLIYLGPPLQKRAIEIFHYALNPGGYLVLGRSETVGSRTDLFEPLDGRWKIYRRQTTENSSVSLGFSVRTDRVLALTPVADPKPRAGSDIQVEASRLLVERYAPPAIVVDSGFRIVRSTGRTARYLELPTGDASLDVLRMARRGLLSSLRSALQEARRLGGTVRREGVRVASDEGERCVSLEVTPLGHVDNRHFLIQFEEQAAKTKARVKSETRSKPGARARNASAVARLEDELTSTRQDLQAMIQDLEAANEELQSANEEILSSNEELQSTNEELDTAREELQSTNEELSTVNDELEGRNTQLTEVNSDLVNLLASVQIPIVMVSADLKIRRFTPAAERALNLIPSDIGRPIGHIKPNVRCPDLEAIIREVVDTVSVREREVSDADGNTFVLRVRPYKTVDNRIEGAVLTLFDLSTALRLARETGEALMARLPEPALLIDGRLIVQRVNPAFYEKFGGSSAEVDGQPLFALDGGRFDVPGLRRLVEQDLPVRKVVEGYAFTAESKRLGRQHFLLDARYVEADRLGLILLVLRQGGAPA
jgi:two-component system CheB/CheR fusion protein